MWGLGFELRPSEVELLDRREHNASNHRDEAQPLALGDLLLVEGNSEEGCGDTRC